MAGCDDDVGFGDDAEVYLVVQVKQVLSLVLKLI